MQIKNKLNKTAVFILACGILFSIFGLANRVHAGFMYAGSPPPSTPSTPTTGPQPFIVIHIRSLATVEIMPFVEISRDGQTIFSNVPGNEILLTPASRIADDRGMTISLAGDSVYDILITGTDEGFISFIITSFDERGALVESRGFAAVPITRNTVIKTNTSFEEPTLLISTNTNFEEPVVHEPTARLGAAVPPPPASATGPQPFVVVRIMSSVTVEVRPFEVLISRNGQTILSSVPGIEIVANPAGNLRYIGHNNTGMIIDLTDDGIYDVLITVTGEGFMYFTLRFFDNAGSLIEERHFANVPITRNSVIRTNTSFEEPTLLLVDDNAFR